MEDDSINIKISSQSLKRVVIIIIELINRIYSEKLAGFPQGGFELNPEGNILNLENFKFLLSLELEKITYEHLHGLLLEKKYKDFMFEFNLFYNTKFSFSADIKKINKILLTMSRDQIHKVYQIIKVFTKSDAEPIKENVSNCESYSMPQRSKEINKKEIFKIPEKGKLKNHELARTHLEDKNATLNVNLGFSSSTGKQINLFFSNFTFQNRSRILMIPGIFFKYKFLN
jgi:hypothetical protein